MDTAAPTAMRTNDLLTLTQWLSPSYPVGAFAYSHGLEAAVDAGWIDDSKGLQVWLESLLEYGAGRSDGLFIAAAFNAETADQLVHVDAQLRAFAASKERLLETDQQGWAFGKVTSALWTGDYENLSYPVALGHAARVEDLPLELTITLYLQSFLSNLVAAGQRLLPIGQTEAQRIVQQLSPLCAEIAADSVEGDLNNLNATTFLSDVASMKHETQYSRIFRT